MNPSIDIFLLIVPEPSKIHPFPVHVCPPQKTVPEARRRSFVLLFSEDILFVFSLITLLYNIAGHWESGNVNTQNLYFLRRQAVYLFFLKLSL